jgi:hypothetical protein
MVGMFKQLVDILAFSMRETLIVRLAMEQGRLVQR